MKSELFVILLVVAFSVAVSVACKTASAPPLSASATLINSEAPIDGTDPPHAVDIAGKAIPASSATQPDKPIILAKDSGDPKWGELKTDAAFDHAKHNTDLTHTLDGKTLTTCVECHHTDQPSASGKMYLKLFERKEALTTAQLDTSKQPVKSCRVCHLQVSTDETAQFPPRGVKYAKETGKPPSGKLTNDVAYHLKCISCHDTAKKRDATLKAPQQCDECHKKNS